MIVQPSASSPRAPCEPPFRAEAASGGFLQAFRSGEFESDPGQPPPDPSFAVEDGIDIAEAETTAMPICPNPMILLQTVPVLDATQPAPPVPYDLDGVARSDSEVAQTDGRRILALAGPPTAVTPCPDHPGLPIPLEGGAGDRPAASPAPPPAPPLLATAPFHSMVVPSARVVRSIANPEMSLTHSPDALPVTAPVARPVAEQIWAMQGLLPTPSVPSAKIHPALSADTRREPSPDAPDGLATVSHGTPLTLPAAADAAQIVRLATDGIPVIVDPEASPATGLPVAFGAVAAPGDGSIRHTQPTPVTPAAIGPALVAIAADPLRGTVTLTLAPDDLGSLHVRMTQGEGGLHVTLSADRPETLDLMRRHASELAQDLRQAGYASPTFSFTQGSDAGGAGASGASPRAASPEGLPPATPTPPAPGFPPSPAGHVTTGAGLDLRL